MKTLPRRPATRPPAGAPVMADTDPGDAGAALAALADRLRGSAGDLRAAWRRRAAAQPAPSPLGEVGRREFDDAFPEAVEGLADRLHRPPDGRRTAIPAAGLDRDWRRFRATALAAINEHFRAAGPVPPDVPRRARKVLSKFVFNGIDRSAARYRGMIREECDGRVGGLSDTVRRQALAAEERGEQLRQAAHDLRGGLAAVKLAARVLRDPATAPALRDEMLGAIGEAADEASRMVADLLSAGRLESGVERAEPADADLGRLLTRLCDSVRPAAAARGAEVRADGPATLPARTDPMMVRRVVQNLVFNALKYGGEGVAVRVSWAADPGAGFRIAVEDDGPGLPPAVAAAVDAVVEGDEAADLGVFAGTHVRGGEGVGLSIVRRLAEELGADLACRTGPAGTRFVLFLPERPLGPG